MIKRLQSFLDLLTEPLVVLKILRYEFLHYLRGTFTCIGGDPIQLSFQLGCEGYFHSFIVRRKFTVASFNVCLTPNLSEAEAAPARPSRRRADRMRRSSSHWLSCASPPARGPSCWHIPRAR